MKKIILLLAFVSAFGLQHANSQLPTWQTGIKTDEFIFEKAPFPESHAATVAETPKGIIAAWFGGTKERNPDV